MKNIDPGLLSNGQVITYYYGGEKLEKITRVLRNFLFYFVILIK